MEETLDHGLKKIGLSLPNSVKESLCAYVFLLSKWNRVYNLTAVKDVQQMMIRHILDSLVILPYLTGSRILDVGTGAGLPGIPLALATPDKQYVLLDSNRKKTRFVMQAISELPVVNATVVQTRVEEYQAEPAFDTIVSRAYSSIQGLAESAGHLCTEQGQLLAMKGAYPLAELDQSPSHFDVTEITPLHVPGLDAQRHLVILSNKSGASA